MTITALEANWLRLPQGNPRLSLTEPNPRPGSGVDVLIVCLRTDDGLCGLGFTQAGAGLAAMHALIEREFPALVTGENPLEVERLFQRARAHFRSAGWHGLTARAWAAVDIALWDLKAQLAGLPLYQLLGKARSSASVYLGDVAVLGREPARVLEVARPLIEDGVLGLYVEAGVGDVQLDADHIQQIRDGIGENAWLGVAVEGRYDLGTAMAMAHFYEEDVGIDRYDTPLPGSDAMGYHRLAERMEVPLAVGNSFDRRDDFRRVLEGGDVRVLRPDPLRLGGITPLLKVAALAEAYPVVITPYRSPEIAVHLACGLGNVDAVEFAGALSPIFAEPLRIEKGKLLPPAKPGHGFALHPEALRRYAVTE